MKKIQSNTVNLKKAKNKNSQNMWDLLMINKF